MQEAFRDAALEALLSRRGAVTRIARHCRISTAAVSQWPRVPDHRVDAVAAALGVTPAQVRPDLYTPAPEQAASFAKTSATSTAGPDTLSPEVRCLLMALGNEGRAIRRTDDALAASFLQTHRLLDARGRLTLAGHQQHDAIRRTGEMLPAAEIRSLGSAASAT